MQNIMSKRNLSILIQICVCGFSFSCASPEINDKYISNQSLMMSKRLEMFDALVKEIDRVDADRKDILKLKGIDWDQNILDLRSEIEKAETPQELGRALRKIDSLYPHIQSQQVLNPELESVPLGSKVVLPFKMVPTIKDSMAKHFKYFIAQVSPDNFEPGPVPHKGDEVVEINGKGIEEWEKENFRFCKSTSAAVCALELNHNFRNENIGWSHEQPIEMQVLHGADKINVKLIAKIEASGGFEPSETADIYNDVFPCGIDIKRRYFEFGFLYKGRRLCVLGSHSHPGVAVMRIANFNYSGNADSIRTLKQEISLFKSAYWNQHSSEIKNLVIDLIDNEGGDPPVGYEALLFDHPFQGQYVKYKKLPEWTTGRIDDNLFTLEGDGGKVIWMKSMKEEGRIAQKAMGDFFDPIPRYCVSSKLDCRSGKFEPDGHPFKGEVRVMLNQNCILACSSFVADLHEHLGERVSFYGLPDSGDSVAAQMSTNLYLTPTGKKPFEIKSRVWNFAAPPITKDLLLTQTLAFSVTTDAIGTPVSGQSQKIKKMPELNYKNYPMNFPGEVLKLILNDIKTSAR